MISGPSWEGFAVENTLATVPVGTQMGLFTCRSREFKDLLRLRVSGLQNRGSLAATTRAIITLGKVGRENLTVLLMRTLKSG
jgi:hypothetical protein